jgi:chromosome segregation ATPase
MTVNFETLAKAEQVKSIVDYERYQNLLRDLAEGKIRDDAEILEILERVGRNVNMLKEDYEWRAKRDAMIAEVRKQAEYQADQQAADAELKTLREEFAKIEAEYDEKRWKLNAKYDHAKAKINEIQRFCSELVKDCRDPNLHGEIEKLESQRQNLGSTRYLMDQAEQARLQIVYRQSELDQMPRFCHGRDEKQMRLHAAINESQAQFDEIQLKIDSIDAKEKEIEAAKQEVYGRMVFA